MNNTGMERSENQNQSSIQNNSTNNAILTEEKHSLMNVMSDKTFYIFDDLTNFNPPPKIRTRVDNEAKKRSLNDIETRLKEAKLRRQKFLEWLANKAKNRLRKRIVLPMNDDTEERVMRIEAKLSAAELKREERAEELRQKHAQLDLVRKEVRANAEHLREQKEKMCGSALEVRVAQAEANREAMVQARTKRRASLHCWADQILANREQAARLYDEKLLRRRDSILQKMDAANAKREARLAAESTRARSITTQARQVAERVWRERQINLQLRLLSLERKIERARRRRKEILHNRIVLRRCGHFYRHKDCAEHLSHKLSRCWRRFLKSQSTTVSLTQSFFKRELSLSSCQDLPFDEISKRITSSETLSSIRLLLSRLQKKLVLSSVSYQSPNLSSPSSSSPSSSRRMVQRAATLACQVSESDASMSKSSIPSNECVSFSNIVDIDHLLLRLTPSKKTSERKKSIPNLRSRFGSSSVKKEKRVADSEKEMNRMQESKGGEKEEKKEKEEKDMSQRRGQKESRYPERVFLCAYMIQFHPDAVFSENGSREKDLSSSTMDLLQSFESLLNSIVRRRDKKDRKDKEEGDGKDNDMKMKENENGKVSGDVGNEVNRGDDKSFIQRLRKFDSHWVTYLQCFVAWKVRDELQLESELIAMACNLERSKISILNSFNAHPKEKEDIRVQVENDQNLLSERIFRLTGASGKQKLEKNLLEIRNFQEMGTEEVRSIHSNSEKDKKDVSVINEVSEGMKSNVNDDRSEIKEIEEKVNGKREASSEEREKEKEKEKEKESGLKGFEQEKNVKYVGLELESEKDKKMAETDKMLSEQDKKTTETDKMLSEQDKKTTETDKMLSEKEYENCVLLNEIIFDSNFKFSFDKLKEKEEEMDKKMDDNNEIWIRLESDLMRDPIESCHVIKLIKDIFMDIAKLKREKNAQNDMDEYFNADYLKHIFKIENLDFKDLKKILDYFIHAIMALDSLEKEKKTKMDYQILLEEIHADVARFLAEKDKAYSDLASMKLAGKKIFSKSILTALKFVYKRLQILKKDIIFFRINLLSNTILRGNNGISYLRSSFSKKFSLHPFVENLFSGSLTHAVVAESPSELKQKLPKTATWFDQTHSEIATWIKPALETAMSASFPAMEEGSKKDPEYSDSEDSEFRGRGKEKEKEKEKEKDAMFMQMRAGRKIISSSSEKILLPEAKALVRSGVLNLHEPQAWFSLETILTVGFLNFTKMSQAVTDGNVVETFWLDLKRIRSFQERFQRLVVTATGLLIVSQVLALRSIPGKSVNFDSKSQSSKILTLLEDSRVSLDRISKHMADISQDALRGPVTATSASDSPTSADPSASDSSSMRAMMSRMLLKALSPDDVVFVRVTKAIFMATVVVALLGEGSESLGLAEAELKKIGASYLLVRVQEVCGEVREIIRVHSKVYSPWYGVLLSSK